MFYYVWITSLSAFGDDRIAATMVKRGYTVKALSSTLTHQHKGTLGAVIALRIHKEFAKEGEVIDQKSILDEVVDVLKFHKLKYMSIIVSGKPAEGTSCRWDVGNIEDTKDKPEEEKKKQVN